MDYENRTDFDFDLNLGQNVQEPPPPFDICVFSVGGEDGTLYELNANLIHDCVMCKE